MQVKKDTDAFAVKIENDGNSAGTSGNSYADASDGLWVDTRWNTATNTPFQVTTNSGNKPIIVAKGNGSVGIGTSSPSYKADILATDQLALRLNTTDADGCFLAIQTNGTAKGYLGSSHHLVAGSPSENDITLRAENNLQFTTGGGTERMRIDSSGRLLVNTTSTIGGARFNVEHTTDCIGCNLGPSASGTRYFMYFTYNGTNVGSIQGGPSSTAFTTSSDYRLKENVVAMSGATERLKQLNPSRFNFIVDADTTVDGFLAHEVQAVVPEAITGTKDAMKDEEYEVTPAVLDDDDNVTTEAVMGTRSVPDYQGIDQSKLVPLLVATIQELEARLTALENN
jgi:hypothetical protein